MPATATAPAEQAKDKKDAQASAKQDKKDAKPAAEQAKQQDAKPAEQAKAEAKPEPKKKDGPITIPRYSETKNTIRYAGEGIAVLALDRTEFEALGNPRKVVVTIAAA